MRNSLQPSAAHRDVMWVNGLCSFEPGKIDTLCQIPATKQLINTASFFCCCCFTVFSGSLQVGWAVPWVLSEARNKQCRSRLSPRLARQPSFELISGKVASRARPTAYRRRRLRCIMHATWLKRIVALLHPLTARISESAAQPPPPSLYTSHDPPLRL